MPRAARAFAVVFAMGLILLLCLATFERRPEAFALGVAPLQPLSVAPSAVACQRSIEPPADFDRVRLEVASRGLAPPVYEVTVLSRGRVLARDRSSRTIGGRIADVARVGEVPAGESISLCVRNSGRRRLELYGNSGASNASSATYLQGERLDFDIDLRFLRPEDASLLSLAGDMVGRAALFRGEWIGPWSVWPIVLLLVTGFPFLLFRALQRACD